MLRSQVLTISNTGAADLWWAITEHAGSACSDPVDLSWISVSPPSGTISPTLHTFRIAIFDATGLTAGSTYTGTLCLTSNDPNSPQVTVPLTLQVLPLKIHLPLILR